MPRVLTLYWSLVFACHLAAAGGWWWIMPGGFPLGHARFWANCGLPAVVAAISLLGIVGVLRGGRALALVRFAALALAVLWTAAAVATTAIFPVSRKLPVLVGLAVAALLWLGMVRLFLAARVAGASNSPPQKRTWPIVLASVLGVILGITLPWTQRGPMPDTRPLNVAIPTTPREAGGSPERVVELCDGVSLYSAPAVVRARRGGLLVDVEPLLTFRSRSADRFWTSLAKPSDRTGPSRRLLEAHRLPRGAVLRYTCDGAELLDVLCRDGSATSAVVVEATCELPRDVYSHLNSFTELHVTGHKVLSLRFSPCPDVPVEVTPSDYPVGRPRRFAYFDGVDELHVVEATSGEKGPFRPLASGPLKRGDLLTITLCDDGKPACSITLLDFTGQCGAQLSPTAGWGVPVNAIELTRDGEAANSPASIWITLAGTSIGRGWDSVGHRAGVYRNRLRIE